MKKAPSPKKGTTYVPPLNTGKLAHKSHYGPTKDQQNPTLLRDNTQDTYANQTTLTMVGSGSMTHRGDTLYERGYDDYFDLKKQAHQTKEEYSKYLNPTKQEEENYCAEK